MKRFHRFALNAGKESILLKLLLTSGWVVLAAGLGVAFPLLWRGEGVSILSCLVAIGCCLWLLLQRYTHRDHSKQSATLLLQGLTVCVLPFAAYMLITEEGPRPLAMLMVVLLPLPVAILWWHEPRRLPMLRFVLLWAVVAFISALAVRDRIDVKARSLGTAGSVIYNAMWFPAGAGAGPAYAALGDSTDYPTGGSAPTLTILKNGGIIERALPDGDWFFGGKDSQENSILLVRDVEETDVKPVSRSELYRLNANRKLTQIAATSGTKNILSIALRPEALMSPRGQYFLTGTADSESTRSKADSIRLTIMDLKSNILTRHPKFKMAHTWRWTTSTTLEILHKDDEMPGQISSGNYEVWELNAATGESTRKRKVAVGTGNGITHHRSYSHALVLGRSVFAIMNLDNGSSISLPLPVDNRTISWAAPLNRVVYRSHGNGVANRLIFAGPGGIIATLPIDWQYGVNTLSISPDGNKVFMALRRNGVLLAPLAQLLVWDVLNQRREKVGRVPLLGTFLAFIVDNSRIANKPVQWTPGSGSVIWPQFRLFYDRKIRGGMEFLTLDCEDN